MRIPTKTAQSSIVAVFQGARANPRKSHTPHIHPAVASASIQYSVRSSTQYASLWTSLISHCGGALLPVTVFVIPKCRDREIFARTLYNTTTRTSPLPCECPVLDGRSLSAALQNTHKVRVVLTHMRSSRLCCSTFSLALFIIKHMCAILIRLRIPTQRTPLLESSLL